MPHKCVVPLCKGNYKTGKKVSTFSFPTDVELRNQWIIAIRRDNFAPTKHSRVCEQHFQETDILTVTTFHVESTGETLTAKLKVRRLKPGAVPSIFPDFPTYLQSTVNVLGDPVPTKKVLEGKNIKKATRGSVKKKSDTITRGLKMKRKRFNPPQSETALPDTEPMHTVSSTSSLLDPNIIIKQEIIETDDDVPNVSTLDMEHFSSTLIPPEMIKQEKSPDVPVTPTVVDTLPSSSLIINQSNEPSVGILEPEIPEPGIQPETYSIVRVGDSNVLLSTKALENATYNIVNFSTNLPNIASSSNSTISVSEKGTGDSKDCSKTFASTSVDGKVKDQFDVYGEYIAAKLRNLDSKSCAYVQMAFGEILFDAEMGKFLHRNDLPVIT